MCIWVASDTASITNDKYLTTQIDGTKLLSVFREFTPCVTTKDFYSITTYVNIPNFCEALVR